MDIEIIHQSKKKKIEAVLKLKINSTEISD